MSYLLILLLLIPNVAMANTNSCESYNKCLETAKWQTKEWGDDNSPQEELLYAIAYKLADIEKKLDK